MLNIAFVHFILREWGSRLKYFKQKKGYKPLSVIKSMFYIITLEEKWEKFTK